MKLKKTNSYLLFISSLKKRDILFENTNSYLSSCIDVKRDVLDVLKPKDKLEVQEIVKLANKYCVSLYPISKGNNWGYGASNPVEDNCVIVDLSNLNKIIDYDSTLGYVRIGPGVTQEMLSEFLEDKNFKMDPTGSSPQTSVLANCLERGFGIGFLNNHFENISALEVILPSGDFLKTGFSHYANSKNSNVYKYGVGPYIDGIFSQSNFGIVVEATIYLSPKFELTKLVLGQFDDEDTFLRVIDCLQKLRINEIIRSPVNVFYKNRLLSVKTKFPFSRTNKSFMDDNLSSQLAKENSISNWTISSSIFGTKAQVGVAESEIKKEFKKIGVKLHFFSQNQIENLGKYRLLSPIFKIFTGRDLVDLQEILKKGIDILRGIPSNVSMRSPYFRSKSNFDDKLKIINPASDNCGLYWISPIIPFKSKDVLKCFKLGKKIFEKHGFDFAPTYTTGGARFIDNTIALMYRKEDKNEVIRAQRCYIEMIETFKKEGYMIYRAGITSMNLVVDRKDIFWEFNKRIKNAIDPNNIIAPGRYQ